MYSVHGKICTLLKLHFRRYPSGNRFDPNWADIVLHDTCQSTKKKSVQFRNHKPFFIRHLQHSLASSRHAGRKWMKKAGGFSLFFFSTTFWLCDTKHYTKHWPYLHSYWCRREKKSAAAVVPPLFFPPPPKCAAFIVITKNESVTCWGSRAVQNTFRHCKRYTVKTFLLL